ncbi:putative solid-state culture specific protein [Aspergillus udagawae]|uniref:Uncharacterized protein n=1 Tax=Aspergillus udagawae TaxID=91492 RepID=A0A8E0V5T6_9EURO|nr:uncharacterized protein Aud_010207 [Aspergillus udagawae]GIC93719.1 hypothetical protein Aud_010207 [Aspergillus udagawae]
MDPPFPITLDYTLHDHYPADAEDGLNTVLVYYPLQFEHNREDKSTKFAYGYKVDEEDEDSTLSLTMAANLVPQRYAFSAGRMHLVILDVIAQRKLNSECKGDPLADADDSVSAHHLDIYQTFAQLQPDQRPILSFANSPENPVKKWAVSGLPTPPSRVTGTMLVDYEDPSVLALETARMTGSIEQRQVPFMFKPPSRFQGWATSP